MLLKITCVIVGLASILTYIIFYQSSMKSTSNVAINSSIKNYSSSFFSSVWCHYDKTDNKICTFQNLYYLPEYQNFIFILTNQSVISGLRSKNDLKTISLSSVVNHNNMFLSLQIVPVFNGNFSLEDFIFINEPIFLIKRFKPDNIMHVIHDDILPLFVTYSHLCSGNVDECIFNNRLMFMDDGDGDNYFEFYSLFSFKKPFNLKNAKTVSCFNKISVGLVRETVWFQYGFGISQGPIESATIDSLTINMFTSFILRKFKIKTAVKSLINEEIFNIVLFSRRSNRKIVNEKFVTDKIKQVFKNFYGQNSKTVKIYVLDPSQNTSTEILNILVTTKILVGMHGSAMIYSMFLPKNSAILELFPFGIQPQHVSSTRALCQLPGIFYHYLSWRNHKENNSIPHPEFPALLGGIKHLSLDKQNSIQNLKNVPAVKCCHEPAYLYRMFQDTIVDESFEIIFKQLLINQKEVNDEDSDTYIKDYFYNHWFFPGTVFNVSCNINKIFSKLFIEWREPYNVKIQNSFKTNEHLYYVTIKVFTRVVTVETFFSSISIKLTSEEINSDIQEKSIQIWIKTVINKIEGSDIHAYCSFVN